VIEGHPKRGKEDKSFLYGLIGSKPKAVLSPLAEEVDKVYDLKVNGKLE
jgi:hypothetical protein